MSRAAMAFFSPPKKKYWKFGLVFGLGIFGGLLLGLGLLGFWFLGLLGGFGFAFSRV